MDVEADCCPVGVGEDEVVAGCNNPGFGVGEFAAGKFEVTAFDFIGC